VIKSLIDDLKAGKELPVNMRRVCENLLLTLVSSAKAAICPDRTQLSLS
jgi:hypothetical protein